MEKEVKKILFIHGLASSGAFKTAGSLRQLLAPCEVLAPDIPIEPDKALALLQGICTEFRPDLIVGLSLGGFWAQKLRGFRKILINPDLHVSQLLREHIGPMDYLCPRRDGAFSFNISTEICEDYEALERVEFDNLDDAERALTRGLFASGDELVNCREEFCLHYPGRETVYPGRHLPNHNEIRDFLVPVAEELF